jgi:hypothetical protein
MNYFLHRECNTIFCNKCYHASGKIKKVPLNSYFSIKMCYLALQKYFFFLRLIKNKYTPYKIDKTHFGSSFLFYYLCKNNLL